LVGTARSAVRRAPSGRALPFFLVGHVEDIFIAATT